MDTDYIFSSEGSNFTNEGSFLDTTGSGNVDKDKPLPCRPSEHIVQEHEKIFIIDATEITRKNHSMV